MKNRLKISVITVCFNAESTIEKTIQSIIRQHYQNLEYIIVDGKSIDNTLSIIARYDKFITSIISEKDKGIYDAMNKSLKIATGDYLIFINCGDTLEPNILCEISDILNYDNNAIWYGNIIKIPSKEIYGGKFNALRIWRNNICHQSIFYPKVIYKSLFYNTTYKTYADWDYNMRSWKELNGNFKYLGKIIALYDENGLSSQRIDNNFDTNYVDIVKMNFGFIIGILAKLRKLYLIKRNGKFL